MIGRQGFQASRRWPRFNLLSLLVLVSAISVALGLVTREWHPAHRKRQVADEIRRIGGHVYWGEAPEAKGIVSGWLHLFLGNAYFAEARHVRLRPRSEEDLDLLHTFPSLESLNLDGPEVTDGAIERLAGLRQLRALQLTNAVIGEPGLQALKELPNLSYLWFRSCSLSNVASEGGLQRLRELPSVRTVRFEKCGLSDDSLKTLHGAPSLVDLYLNEPNVTEAEILALRSSNPALSVNFDKQLNYRGQQLVFENFLPCVEKLPHVNELAFKGPCTSDETLVVLRNARSLTSLRLERCRVSDAGLENLGTLLQLAKLELYGTNVTETRESELRRWAPELASLTRGDCRITDRGLEHLGHLNALTDLLVVDCHITDEGMNYLQSIKSLSSLTISGSGITDEGVRRLHGLSHLRRLTLTNTSVSDAGIAGIQQALPGCAVTRYPQTK